MVCARLDKIESGTEKMDESAQEIRGIALQGCSGVKEAMRVSQQVRDSVEKLRQSLSTFSRTLFDILKDGIDDGGASK